MPKFAVSRAGVLNVLSIIKANKATGLAGILGKLLKICADDIADVLSLLFQSSLDQSCLPSDWNKIIVPVFKKNVRGIIENYRPISLTSVNSKILEHSQ